MSFPPQDFLLPPGTREPLWDMPEPRDEFHKKSTRLERFGEGALQLAQNLDIAWGASVVETVSVRDIK